MCVCVEHIYIHVCVFYVVVCCCVFSLSMVTAIERLWIVCRLLDSEVDVQAVCPRPSPPVDVGDIDGVFM